MKLSMIYMASGFGSRFGSNKLLVPLKGKPLFLHGLEHLMDAAGQAEAKRGICTEIIVVSQYEEILQMLRSLPSIKTVHNTRSKEGITASLKLGTEAACQDTDGFLYFVADEPYMTASTLARFVTGFADSKKGMGCVCCGGRPGNPAVFGKAYRQELLALTGDRGGRAIMAAHPEDVWTMEAPQEELRDIDCLEDLRDIDCPKDLRDIDCPEELRDIDCPEDLELEYVCK